MAVVLTVRWNGNEYHVSVEPNETMTAVKTHMKERANVEVGKQKYIGLKTTSGKPTNDATLVSELLLKPGQKIMMLGYRPLLSHTIEISER